MNSELLIICPEIAPGSGGVADYTLRIADAWGARVAPRFIVPRPAASNPNLPVEVIERRRSALKEKLPARGGKILLQYSAYGFDHFGYPRWLLHALADWKASGDGALVIMLHEIWTFWPVLNRNYFVQQLHRRDLRTLVAQADAVFTSTASQAGYLRELDANVTVEVLPVGSNVVPIEADDESCEPGLAVLFGLQSARLRALRTMWKDLESLAAAGHVARLVTLGAGNTKEGDRMEDEILGGFRLTNGAERRGAMPEAEISAQLRRATFGISMQDALSLTKSGSFMAYAAHGLNVLSPFGDTAKPEPLCWLTSPAELLHGLSEDELRARADQLRAWQERTASWPAIAERFAAALSL